MCGIAGIYAVGGIEESDRAALCRMSERISHRGPDDHGFYFDRNVGLAHRRLSIIDLSENGRQPISNEDNTVWLIFNGEIYNFRGLRSDLEKKGHIFKSNTDTEVLLHLYEEFPDGYLEELRGMFAFALWNKKTNKMILARDRLGKKPLYYYHGKGMTVFASEIKAILEHPIIDIAYNNEALTEFLAFRYSVGRQTIFKDIYKVLPGETLNVNLDGIETKKYWEVPVLFEEGDRDLSGEYHSLFVESVKLRLMADVPLGAFLSGGLDSTSVVYAMARYSESPVKTFTMAFDSADKRIEEGHYAEIVAKYFKTNHYEQGELPSSVDQIERMIYHLDEPIADPAVIPTFHLFESASRFLKVILTGEGSDEVNAGYARYPVSNLIMMALDQSGRVSNALGRLMSFIPKHKSLSNMLRLQGNDAWLYLTLLFGREYERFSLIRTILPGNLLESFDGSIGRARELYSVEPSIHPLQKIFYFDIKGWLASDLLMKVDKMSMAHSVEARTPFLDHKLVEFSMGIPPGKKCTLFTTKRLLREAMKDHIPAEILKRRQHGFIVPLESWFRGGRPDFLRAKIKNLIKRGIVKSGSKDIAERYIAGNNSLRSVVWRFIVLETWFEVFMDGKWKDL